MTEEDEEFNRIEREASMRKAAVKATVGKRELVGLTSGEVDDLIEGTDLSGAYYYDDMYRLAGKIEAKLKEKNT